ncbi:cation diffusion facilitator family transporter [Acuticoccus sp. MNP-M23]|uniref:cation diffusion facilitator family transporter n=1 Tax=Acuticoccus sp. MNP-M23 TaxID=3072793 RepID=UPI0028159500|nr:cation diffusion facilitator family transporter [Acuticoccus sp. MNP-M23]WMS44923.1 cation diffusion facilitator family transporter [Acuticoccus sp. MNP-M23]
MGHGHHHHHVDPESGDRRVIFAVLVNVLLTVAQVIGGLFSGSLSLIADALHNLSDAAALGIAFVARKIARRPANETMTFGYQRAEVVAALINYTTLIILSIFLAYEAVMRMFEPEPVAGWIIVIVAGIALVIDLATALLTYSMSKSSVNIRAAFLHNVADALGSVAVIIAGTLVILFNWTIVDPLMTLLIAGYIFWMAIAEVGDVVRILMLGSPPGIEPQAVVAAVQGVDGVTDIHHAHLWQINEHDNALDAHIVIAEGAWAEADGIKAAVKAMLHEKFEIGHSTLEIECANHACVETPVFGDGAHGGHDHAHAQGKHAGQAH